MPWGPEERVPDSLLWDRVQSGTGCHQWDAGAVREAVRDRDRRVMQDEATAEMEGEASSQSGGGERSRQLRVGYLWRQSYKMGPGVEELDLTDSGVNPRISLKWFLPPWPSLLLCHNLLSSGQPLTSILTIAHALQEVLEGLSQLAWL